MKQQTSRTERGRDATTELGGKKRKYGDTAGPNLLGRLARRRMCEMGGKDKDPTVEGREKGGERESNHKGSSKYEIGRFEIAVSLLTSIERKSRVLFASAQGKPRALGDIIQDFST